MATPSYLPQQANIKAYYNLEDVNDNSGNGYNLTNENSVTFSSAKIGNGANFSASNTNKLLYISNNLGVDGGACTFSIWVKLLAEISAGSYTLISQYGSATDTSYKISYDYNGGTRRLIFERTKVNVAAALVLYTITLGTSDWYNIVLTYDATNIRGYVGGALVSTPTAASGNGTDGPDTFSLGAYYYSAASKANYSSVLLDEAVVWNKALTADEVAQVYKGLFIPQIIIF